MTNQVTIEAALATLAKIEKIGASAWELDDDNGSTDQADWSAYATRDGFTFVCTLAEIEILDEDGDQLDTLNDNESELTLRVMSDIADVFEGGLDDLFAEAQAHRDWCDDMRFDGPWA
jgi:hypothetical protein